MKFQFDRLPKIVYHGTTQNHLQSLSEGISPNLTIANTKPDFGKGFYTTTLKEQAHIQANRKTFQHNQRENRVVKNKLKTEPEYTKPLVLEYEVDIEKLKILTPQHPDLKSEIIFKEPNESWAKFIFNNRLEISNEGLHNIDQRFHYVFGPLGDGMMTDLVKKLKKQEISLETFLHKIQPRIEFGKCQDQLSFHTLKAIESLTLKGVF